MEEFSLKCIERFYLEKVMKEFWNLAGRIFHFEIRVEIHVREQ